VEQIGGTELKNGESSTPAAGRRGSRRWPAIVAAAALAALAAAGCGGSPGPSVGIRPGMTGPVIANESSGTGSRSGVAGGALFGGNASLVREETALGRKLAIVRVYYRFGDSFPTYTDSQIMASGSTLMLSLNTPSGGPTYASIAAGQYDGYLSSFLQAVNQAAIRYHLPAIYFSFEHESSLTNKHAGLGSPAQLVQAWDHIHQLAATMHLNWNDGGRIHWVWIQLYGTFLPVNQRLPGWPIFGAPTAYWPGRNEVDIVAADGYSHPGCHGHAGPMTPQSLFGPVLSFAHRNGGLPVFITEWGSTAFPSSQWQTGFIGQMQAFVAANPEIVAVLYWNSRGIGPHCTFSVNDHPASVSALATMAHSDALQGRLG
jgi:hypothetical protein